MGHLIGDHGSSYRKDKDFRSISISGCLFGGNCNLILEILYLESHSDEKQCSMEANKI